MATMKEIYLEAWHRGYDRGLADKDEGYVNDSPLSGEWAGESIPELLGDLIKQAMNTGISVLMDIDEDHIIQELCDEYEDGYFEANDIERVYE